MVVFSWSFPKTISMCHTRPRHCFNEDKTDVPILFLINLWWPLFFFYYWVPFVTYCWLFPQSQALVFLVTWLKAEAAWSFLLFLFLFLFVNEWSFFLKEHDLCTLVSSHWGSPFTWYVILNLLVSYKWAWLSSFDYVRL